MNFLALVTLSLSLFAGGEGPRVYNIWGGTPLARPTIDVPRLTSFAAGKNYNTHVAVIICPGGSYYHLAINQEGYSVAGGFSQEG